MTKLKRWGDPPYYRISHEFSLKKMSSRAILVMVSLSSHMNNETCECFVSYRTLREETHLGNTSIVKALRELREQGFVGKSRRFSKSNIYVLVVPSGLAQGKESGAKARRKTSTKGPSKTRIDPPFLIDPDAPAEDYYG